MSLRFLCNPKRTTKVPLESIRPDFVALGLTDEVIDSLVQVLAIKSVDELRALLGNDSKALDHLTSLFTYAEAYGFSDWLVFDASVVRGLSYYTGVVFEAFDRSGEFRVSYVFRHLRRAQPPHTPSSS